MCSPKAACSPESGLWVAILMTPFWVQAWGKLNSGLVRKNEPKTKLKVIFLNTAQIPPLEDFYANRSHYSTKFLLGSDPSVDRERPGSIYEHSQGHGEECEVDLDAV